MAQKSKGILNEQDLRQILLIVRREVKREVKQESALTREYVRDYVDARVTALEKSMKEYTHTYVGQAVKTIMDGMDNLVKQITNPSKVPR